MSCTGWSITLRCYWLSVSSAVMLLTMETRNVICTSRDSSIVTVKKSSIISQIVSCPVVLSCLVLLNFIKKSLYGAGNC